MLNLQVIMCARQKAVHSTDGTPSKVRLNCSVTMAEEGGGGKDGEGGALMATVVFTPLIAGLGQERLSLCPASSDCTL